MKRLASMRRVVARLLRATAAAVDPGPTVSEIEALRVVAGECPLKGMNLADFLERLYSLSECGLVEQDCLFAFHVTAKGRAAIARATS